MQLNRKQRRIMNINSEDGKRIQNYSFMHPERVENRKANLERGNKQHENFVNVIQETIVERLSDKESALKNELKTNKISDKKMEHYLDVWSGINFWPKPNDYQSLRKELKILNKEYNING